MFERDYPVAARRSWLTVSAVMLAAGFSTKVVAQDIISPTPPSKLPRPGYEYNGVEIGSFNLKTDVDASIDHTSNIFLTSANEAADFRLHINPSVILTKGIGSGAITAEANLGLRRHFNFSRENSVTYGASVNYNVSGAKAENFDATITTNRNIERRADPETRAGPTDRPRKVNAFLARAVYNRASGKVRIRAALTTEKFNQLSAADDDRDMQLYRASFLVGYRLASSLDFFAQVFVNRRDFRLARDFSGVDRDQNTYGAIIGLQRDIGNRLHGKLGAGVFRTDPDRNAILPPYTGLRLDGEVTWMPRDRTAFNFRVSRGDVATVRSGASNRVDTVARLTVDQEIRHYLLGHISIAYSDFYYRGLSTSRDNLKSVGGIARLEYLLDRRTSFFTSAEYEQRKARDPFDEYNEAIVTLGITRRF